MERVEGLSSLSDFWFSCLFSSVLRGKGVDLGNGWLLCEAVNVCFKLQKQGVFCVHVYVAVLELLKLASLKWGVGGREGWEVLTYV